jgi:hypothetical protein
LPLLSRLDGVHRVIARGDALPRVDLHCPLLSLPLAFQTTLATIPARVPYVAAAPERAAAWRAKLGEAQVPRIGLAWAGNPTHRNDRNRSIGAPRFAPLLRLNAAFVSLQKDPNPEDRHWLATQPKIDHRGDALRDFADTAALLSLLDLVISADTAVAHLAGALGKPVWILLPYLGVDWRWLLDRADSPWYPTARLFRQPVIDGWTSVIDAVTDEAMRLID